MMIAHFDKVENTAGKEEMLVTSISPLPSAFSKAFFSINHNLPEQRKTQTGSTYFAI